MEIHSSYSTLRKLARQIWEKLETVDTTAVSELATAIRQTRRADIAVHFAAWVLIHEQMRHSRGLRARSRRGTDTTSDIPTSEDALADDLDVVVRWRVGAWPLRSGRPLHDATEQELRAQIDLHRKNETGNRLAAEFHERILEERKKRRSRPSDPCSKTLCEEDFDAIYREVYGEEAA